MVLGYGSAAFSGGVVGISLASVICALGVPVKLAFYGNCPKLATRATPVLVAVASAIFSFGFVSGYSLMLPAWVSVVFSLFMGVILGMIAVSLAEMLDVFTGPLGFLRPVEIRYLSVFIALGKAIFSAYSLIAGGM